MKQGTRKQQIVNIAARLFKERGYSAVTMRDIATSMGIKASSLYNHINSKQDILTNIIIFLAEEFTNGMEDIKVSNINSIEKLNKIIEIHVNITIQNTFEMASLNNDWMHLEERLDYYLKLRDNYEDNFRKIIVEGMENNEIIKGNPEVILFSILSTLRSLYLWIPKKEEQKPEDLAQNLTNVLINGVKA